MVKVLPGLLNLAIRVSHRDDARLGSDHHHDNDTAVLNYLGPSHAHTQ